MTLRNLLAAIGLFHVFWFCIGATDMIDYYLCIKPQGECGELRIKAESSVVVVAK